MRTIETLRTLDAAARAAPRSHSNRDAVMTRHGKRSPRAETPLVAAIAICAPFANSVTRDLNLAGGQLPIRRPPGAKPHSPRPCPPRHSPGAAIIPARAKAEIPIDRCRRPAGSCLGGFRTPNGIRKPSPLVAIQRGRAVSPNRTYDRSPYDHLVWIAVVRSRAYARRQCANTGHSPTAR